MSCKTTWQFFCTFFEVLDEVGCTWRSEFSSHLFAFFLVSLNIVASFQNFLHEFPIISFAEICFLCHRKKLLHKDITLVLKLLFGLLVSSYLWFFSNRRTVIPFVWFPIGILIIRQLGFVKRLFFSFNTWTRGRLFKLLYERFDILLVHLALGLKLVGPSSSSLSHKLIRWTFVIFFRSWSLLLISLRLESHFKYYRLKATVN